MTVAVEKNMTGEAIIGLTVLLPFAPVVIKEVSKIVRGQQATMRAQKLKIGKGTMSFEGFSPDEICSILDKLHDLDIK